MSLPTVGRHAVTKNISSEGLSSVCLDCITVLQGSSVLEPPGPHVNFYKTPLFCQSLFLGFLLRPGRGRHIFWKHQHMKISLLYHHTWSMTLGGK